MGEFDWVGDQKATLDKVRAVMRSLGTSEPKGMKRGVGPVPTGFAGAWWPQIGHGRFTSIPSKLHISPTMAGRPSYQQIEVDTHELGHADHNPTQRGPGAVERSVIEPRGVAYEQLFGPVVMRAMGIQVPDEFWTQDQAKHGYLKEFGQKAIDKQKAILREIYGSALYDREDVRAREINRSRHVPEDSIMGPMKPSPRRVPTRAEMFSKIGGQGAPFPASLKRT